MNAEIDEIASLHTLAPRSRRLRLSRVRVGFQVFLHLVLIGHVLAYYYLDWTRVGGLDFQDFFHNLLGQGIVTAAVVFAGSIYLLSLVWGRLFCSWGCHFGATQDLAAWALRKLGWRPPLVRTRFLHWSPFLVLAAVFLWPSVSRWIERGWRFQGAGEGGILGGAGPWERLPGWFLAVTTFLACGAGILLFLGTRGFCRFVCPYGAVFRLTDRVAPYRVRRTGPCATHCGTDAVPPCTRACPTAIDVHFETTVLGKVTSPDCVRCHLCIERCPNQALSYAASAPAVVDQPGAAARPAYTLALWEEALVLGSAIAAYLAADRVFGGHFLAATLALGEGFVALLLCRLARARDLDLCGVALRRGGAWRLSGITAFALGLATILPLYHAASYKVHRHLGMKVFRLEEIDGAEAVDDPESGASGGVRLLALESRAADDLRRAAGHLHRALARFPSDLDTRRALAMLYVELRDERWADEAREILRQSGESRRSLDELRRVLFHFGRIKEARWIEELMRARGG